MRVEIALNDDENWIELRFNPEPSEVTSKRLNEAGFRPEQDRWIAEHSDARLRFAKALKKELEEPKEQGNALPATTTHAPIEKPSDLIGRRFENPNSGKRIHFEEADDDAGIITAFDILNNRLERKFDDFKALQEAGKLVEIPYHVDPERDTELEAIAQGYEDIDDPSNARRILKRKGSTPDEDEKGVLERLRKQLEGQQARYKARQGELLTPYQPRQFTLEDIERIVLAHFTKPEGIKVDNDIAERYVSLHRDAEMVFAKAGITKELRSHNLLVGTAWDDLTEELTKVRDAIVSVVSQERMIQRKWKKASRANRDNAKAKMELAFDQARTLCNDLTEYVDFKLGRGVVTPKLLVLNQRFDEEAEELAQKYSFHGHESAAMGLRRGIGTLRSYKHDQRLKFDRNHVEEMERAYLVRTGQTLDAVLYQPILAQDVVDEVNRGKRVKVDKFIPLDILEAQLDLTNRVLQLVAGAGFYRTDLEGDQLNGTGWKAIWKATALHHLIHAVATQQRLIKQGSKNASANKLKHAIDEFENALTQAERRLDHFIKEQAQAGQAEPSTTTIQDKPGAGTSEPGLPQPEPADTLPDPPHPTAGIKRHRKGGYPPYVHTRDAAEHIAPGYLDNFNFRVPPFQSGGEFYKGFDAWIQVINPLNRSAWRLELEGLSRIESKSPKPYPVGHGGKRVRLMHLQLPLQGEPEHYWKVQYGTDGKFEGEFLLQRLWVRLMADEPKALEEFRITKKEFDRLTSTTDEDHSTQPNHNNIGPGLMQKANDLADRYEALMDDSTAEKIRFTLSKNEDDLEDQLYEWEKHLVILERWRSLQDEELLPRIEPEPFTIDRVREAIDYASKRPVAHHLDDYFLSKLTERINKLIHLMSWSGVEPADTVTPELKSTWFAELWRATTQYKTVNELARELGHIKNATQADQLETSAEKAQQIERDLRLSWEEADKRYEEHFERVQKEVGHGLIDSKADANGIYTPKTARGNYEVLHIPYPDSVKKKGWIRLVNGQDSKWRVGYGMEDSFQEYRVKTQKVKQTNQGYATRQAALQAGFDKLSADDLGLRQIYPNDPNIADVKKQRIKDIADALIVFAEEHDLQANPKVPAYQIGWKRTSTRDNLRPITPIYQARCVPDTGNPRIEPHDTGDPIALLGSHYSPSRDAAINRCKYSVTDKKFAPSELNAVAIEPRKTLVTSESELVKSIMTWGINQGFIPIKQDELDEFWELPYWREDGNCVLHHLTADSLARSEHGFDMAFLVEHFLVEVLLDQGYDSICYLNEVVEPQEKRFDWIILDQSILHPRRTEKVFQVEIQQPSEPEEATPSTGKTGASDASTTHQWATDREAIGHGVYSKNYLRLKHIIPNFFEGIAQGALYGKSTSSGFMDLHFDFLYKDNEGRYVFALSHTYEMNGDLVPDPDMQLRLDPRMNTLEAMTFQNLYGYQEVYPVIDGKEQIDLVQKEGQNEFLELWLTNLKDQGHKIMLQPPGSDDTNDSEPEPSPDAGPGSQTMETGSASSSKSPAAQELGKGEAPADGTVTNDHLDRMIAHLHDEFAEGRRPTKGYIERLKTELDIPNMGMCWEAAELAWLLWYKAIYREPGIFLERLDKMIHFWNNLQPTYAYSDSSKEVYKQYSTPCPIAAIIAEYTGMARAKRVFEPCAGNGLLVMGADPKTVHANEIDRTRLDSLRFQQFDRITTLNAAQPFPKDMDKTYDVVVTNPPYARWEEEKYDKEHIIQRYFNGQIGLAGNIRLEHLMAGLALRTMKDDGRAAIITMGHVYFKDGFIAKYRPFFNWLFRHYHVDDVINMNSFKLYNKQGAIEKTMLILVSGRKTIPAGVAPTQDEAGYFYDTVNSFDELWERVEPHVNLTLDTLIQQLTLSLQV